MLVISGFLVVFSITKGLGTVELRQMREKKPEDKRSPKKRRGREDVRTKLRRQLQEGWSTCREQSRESVFSSSNHVIFDDCSNMTQLKQTGDRSAGNEGLVNER